MSEYELALAQDENLEKISDDNLVNFYRPELILIGKGGKATAILPEAVVKKFFVMGLFDKKVAYSLSHKGWEIIQKPSG